MTSPIVGERYRKANGDFRSAQGPSDPR